MMHEFILILYLMTTVSTLTLRKIGYADFSSILNPTIRALSDETSDSSSSHGLRHKNIALATEDAASVSKDTFVMSQSSEETTRATRRTTQRHHKRKRRTPTKTTPFTTKYERGTTKKQKRNNLRESQKHHYDKRHNIRTRTTRHIEDYKKLKNNIGRDIGEYVYTFVNNSIDEHGIKTQRIIIYNQSHYIDYKGDVIPKDFVQLYRLWTEVDGAKEFDNTFRPPWWMEWHKPPWWMEWHDPPADSINDTWDLWNKPGMLPPPPYLSIPKSKYVSFDLMKWLSDMWSKVDVEKIEVGSWKEQRPSLRKKVLQDVLDVPSQFLKKVKEFWNILNEGNVSSRSFQPPVKQHANRTKEKKIRSSSSPHKIKDNKEMQSFTEYILNSTLIFFDNVGGRSQEYYWKKGIKRLAKLYKEKYEEFLKDTQDQKIRSDYGTHKVIINAIDVSNRIVTRLLNIMISEMDKLGLLPYTHTAEFFLRELKTEKQRQLKSACSVLKICRSGSGFIQLLLDVLGVILSLEDIKLKKALDSITEVSKNTNFTKALGKAGDIGLKKVIRRLESFSLTVQKMTIKMLKRIIDKRNEPLTVPSDTDSPDSRIANTTLAFQEILNTLDEKVPDTSENLVIWKTIQNDMESWATRDTPDVQGIMERLITHTKDVLENLDEESHNVILQNVNKIVNKYD